MRILSLFLGCLLLTVQAQETQPYLFYTLRTLVQAEQELGRGQGFATRDSLMRWLHHEQHRLLLQVAGTPDKRVQADILEVESALREVQSLAGLRFALVVSRPPEGFSAVNRDQLSLLDDSWLTEKLNTALTYTGALRTLTPSLDWHIVNLMVQQKTPPPPAKPAPVTAVAQPEPAAQPPVAVTPPREPAPGMVQVSIPIPDPAPATPSKPAQALPAESAPPSPQPAVNQPVVLQPVAAQPVAPEAVIQARGTLQQSQPLVLPSRSTPLPPAQDSPEAIRRGLTHPRRPYTRLATVSIKFADPAAPRPLDSLGTARLDPANFSLETVPPESQIVTDTVARWVIRQTAARYAALQNLEIDSVMCQTTIYIQGYAAQTLGNFAEVALKQVQESFPGFFYTTKVVENNRNKKVSLTGNMTCLGQKPTFKQ